MAYNVVRLVGNTHAPVIHSLSSVVINEYQPYNVVNS